MALYRCNCCGSHGFTRQAEVMYHMQSHVTKTYADGREVNLRMVGAEE